MAVPAAAAARWTACCAAAAPRCSGCCRSTASRCSSAWCSRRATGSSSPPAARLRRPRRRDRADALRHRRRRRPAAVPRPLPGRSGDRPRACARHYALRVRRAAAAVGDAAGRDHRAADRVRAGGGDPAAPDRARSATAARAPGCATCPAGGRHRRARRRRGSRRSTSRPSARSRCAAAPTRSPRAASTCSDHDVRRLLGDPRASARGRSRCSACTARGGWTSCPAGDLGFIKIVGRLLHGQPAGARRRGRGARASSRATASGRGSPARTCVHAAARGLIQPARPWVQALARQELVGQRRRALACAALEQLVRPHPAARRRPRARVLPAERVVGVGREEDRQRGLHGGGL